MPPPFLSLPLEICPVTYRELLISPNSIVPDLQGSPSVLYGRNEFFCETYSQFNEQWGAFENSTSVTSGMLSSIRISSILWLISHQNTDTWSGCCAWAWSDHWGELLGANSQDLSDLFLKTSHSPGESRKVQEPDELDVNMALEALRQLTDQVEKLGNFRVSLNGYAYKDGLWGPLIPREGLEYLLEE